MDAGEPPNTIMETVAPVAVAPVAVAPVAVPPAAALFSRRSLVELCRSSWHPKTENLASPHHHHHQTYLRGCKWSPDGTCCLAVVNDGGVHAVELPRELYAAEPPPSTRRPVDVLGSAVSVPEAGLVYDFCWYPGMSSAAPETCCWITTRQNAPLQMWDAFDGQLRCSYRGYNAVDEIEAAISVCFSSDGSQIHAGYKKCIKTFFTDRPGRDCANQPIAGSAASLAVSPTSDTIAVGSWKTEISLYDIQQGSAKSIGKMKAHTGGVTHLKFSPDGNYLVSGARKDDQLMIWDMRLHRKPLKILHRTVETNQRIYFDICKNGVYLVTGTTDGFVKVWNLQDEIRSPESNEEQMYPLHRDCCNGVSIHPYNPILATCSGQYHIVELDLSDQENTLLDNRLHSVDSMEDASSKEDLKVKTLSNVPENSLEFWWSGDVDDKMDI